MKKIFTSMLFACSLILVFSCTKEVNPNPQKGLVFTASIDNSTKTTFSESKVYWESGDQISINGVLYQAAPETDATKATFTKVNPSDPDPVSPFSAYYPANTYNEDHPSLLATQNYEAGKFSNIPMYSEGTIENLVFKNTCGVLAVKVSSGIVNNIQVIVDDAPVCGNMSISSNAAVVGYPRSNRVSLLCGDVTADNTVFYIAIPAGSYNRLQIVLNNTQTMTTVKAVSVERNTVYSINFAAGAESLYHAWVQFKNNQPKWATMNLGATEEIGGNSFGRRYAWGMINEATGGTEYNHSTSDIAGDPSADAARYEWGGLWRMPTSEELYELADDTKYSHESVGEKYSSAAYRRIFLKDFHSNGDLYLILPYSGYQLNNNYPNVNEVGVSAHYWSSTPSSTEKAIRYGVYYSMDDRFASYTKTLYGSIRPVLP